ncbi:MAG: TRAP transporter small permease subunit [Acidimicrobiales bacterium]
MSDLARDEPADGDFDMASVPDDSPALNVFARVHPIGLVSGAFLVAAGLWHTVFDTERLIGNMAWWQWLGMIVVTVLAFMPSTLNTVRVSIEKFADISLKIAWVCGWMVFFAQLINVLTRYLNPAFERDILIGQMTSVAWQLFALMSLLGLNYGVRNQVNPRIDFWWAGWSDRTKAWLDFVMHTFFFIPFLYAMVVILQGFAATALGQRRGDGSWPSGWRVWNTWEESPDADQLALGPIKALIFVGFIFFLLQVFAEVIKTGFVLAGRREYADIGSRDEFQRIE